MPSAKLAILISGRGSNMEALLRAAEDSEYPAEIALVVSNRPNAKGLALAHKAGVRQHVIDHNDFETREDFESALDDALRAADVDYVCLAGFMRILTAHFVDKWRDRIVNIHPSLLPAFKGLHVHERMIDAGVKIAGCTVHFVSAEMDAGPIIGQAALPVHPSDTPDTLAARILELEHRLYPACLRALIEKNARLSGGTVRFEDILKADGVTINPPAD